MASPFGLTKDENTTITQCFMPKEKISIKSFNSKLSIFSTMESNMTPKQTADNEHKDNLIKVSNNEPPPPIPKAKEKKCSTQQQKKKKSTTTLGLKEKITSKVTVSVTGKKDNKSHNDHQQQQQPQAQGLPTTEDDTIQRIVPIELFSKKTLGMTLASKGHSSKTSHHSHQSVQCQCRHHHTDQQHRSHNALQEPDHLEEHNVHRGMCFMVNGFRLVLIVLSLIECYFIIRKMVHFIHLKRQLIAQQYGGDSGPYTTNLIWINLDLLTAVFLLVELVMNGLVLLVTSLVLKMGIFIYNCYVYSGHYDPHTAVETQDLILNGVNNALVLCYALLKGFHVYNDGRGTYQDICTINVH